MAEGIDNIQNRYKDFDTLHQDLFQKASTEIQPLISASENVDENMDNKISFDSLKSTFEGLKEGPNLNHELQMLISTIVSSMAAEAQHQQPLQNTSTDGRSGGVEAVESAGPSNNQGAMRRLQQVLSSDSRFIQQLMDYLSLSSAARKDEHLQNMGLEYKGLPPTLAGYHSKREELFENVKAHVDGILDKAGLQQKLQPILSYIDPAIMVIDNTLKMEEARIAHEQKRNK